MCRVAPTKPTLELLRSLSDEHVLRALMAAAAGHPRRDRRRDRPVEADRLGERPAAERRPAPSSTPGERTTGRGRIGTYYALPATTGCALVASIAPEGIVAEAVDVYGDVVARAEAPVSRARRRAGRADAAAASPARWPPARSGSPSSAPPTRWTARPGGSSSCRTRRSWSARSIAPAVLAGLVDGPVTVDNDVNWAARAEHAAGRATSSTCTSARASAAPWSATARSAAATPGSPARSRTC